VFDQSKANYVENENARRRLCESFDEAIMKGYRWGSQHKVIQELEILRSYFLLKQRSLAADKESSPEIALLSYKSLLTCIMGGSKVFDIENASPLKIIGFFKGAIEALKHRKMTQRRREENKSELRRSLDRRKATATAAVPETRAQNTPRPLRSLSA
jgi:hypothetical protein